MRQRSRRQNIRMPLNVCMQPMSQPTTSSAPRYLLKNVDSFAGFGHCVGTFIAGITIAHRHGLQLIHRPLAAAHGLGYSFGDYFMSDGLVVPPVVTPTFATSDGALWVDGRRTSIYVLADRSSMKADASSIQEAAKELPADTILWLRKGRFSLQEDDPTAAPVAQRYAGLWLRERYWQAFAARSAAAHGPATATVAASPAARPIRVVVHVRRGDVPYIGPKTGLPHPHFVETTAILEVLRGCRDAIGADAWPVRRL